jgi:hypothetical protein
MNAPAADPVEQGVRAATPLPRTWRAYLAVRPEVAALFALFAVVLVLGVAAHRSLYFQVSEVCRAPAAHVCSREHRALPAHTYSRAAPLAPRLQSMSGLAQHPCIFEHAGKIGSDIQDWDMSALSRAKTSCTTKNCNDRSVLRGDEVSECADAH